MDVSFRVNFEVFHPVRRESFNSGAMFQGHIFPGLYFHKTVPSQDGSLTELEVSPCFQLSLFGSKQHYGAFYRKIFSCRNCQTIDFLIFRRTEDTNSCFLFKNNRTPFCFNIQVSLSQNNRALSDCDILSGSEGNILFTHSIGSIRIITGKNKGIRSDIYRSGCV